MRSMKKRLALMVAMVMVLCACMIGCSGGGNSGGSAAKKEENTIPGTYVAEFNALEIMNKSMEESGISLKTEIVADFVLELKEDGTCTFDLDAEGFKDSIIAGITADADDIMTELFASLGVDTSYMEALAKQAGYENYDAFKQALIDEIAAEFDDASIKEMKDSSHAEGKYEVKDKEMTITDEDGGEDKLTINDDGSLSMSMEFEGSDITLTFVKQ